MKISRTWAMPSADTFQIPAVNRFLLRHLNGCKCIVDPFSRNNAIAHHSNDINPSTTAQNHMDARDFLRMLIEKQVRADAILFDPPYSPRQVSECYANFGARPNMEDTQTAKLKKECRDLFRQLIVSGGKVLSFGWNTTGMGKRWNCEEILIVAHGGDHNDTLCMAERYDEMFDESAWQDSNAQLVEVIQ